MDQSTLLEYGAYVVPPVTFLVVAFAVSGILEFSWTVGIAAGFVVGVADLLAWRFLLLPRAT